MITISSLLQNAIESDARYFELGARTTEVEGASIAWTPGFADLPAGCVVQRVRACEIRRPFRSWVESVEAELAGIGAAWSRIYLTGSAPGLDQALLAAGYTRRVEFAFVSEFERGDTPPVCDVRVTPVRTPADWRLKTRIHQNRDRGADGYHQDPARWTSLMQLKARTGCKEPYLIEKSGRVAAEVAVMESGNLLRLKNLYVTPEARGAGLGAQAVAFVCEEAQRRGKSGISVFGVEGSAGANLYQRCGLRIEGEQVEWSRQL